MPIHLIPRHKDRIVEVRYAGRLTDEELLEFWETYASSEDYPHALGYQELSDLSEADFTAVTNDGLSRMISLSDQSSERHKAGSIRVAVYAPTDLQFGMARVCEALSRSSKEEMAVFRDYNAAVQWLLEPRD